MTDIGSISAGGSGGLSGVSLAAGAAGVGNPSPSRRTESARPAGTLRQPDRAELSESAVLFSKLQSLPPVRQELVDSVRDAIDRGEYESAEKLDAAIDELSKDLSDDLDALR
jgi:hypothetical protein